MVIIRKRKDVLLNLLYFNSRIYENPMLQPIDRKPFLWSFSATVPINIPLSQLYNYSDVTTMLIKYLSHW